VNRAWFSTFKLSLIGFLVVLVLAWTCYRPALSGAFQLDDNSNLAGLAMIEDTASAVQFIFSGTAGPLGRPIALWTFATQADQWEQGAKAFLSVNIFIHLLNAVLLAACLYQLSLLQDIKPRKAIIAATAAASCWIMMPLLASASLLVVQRMTTLSALFALLGLFGYLVARRRIEATPVAALAWMGISLAVGTLLATLTKESGFLLPAYVLVIEATVLRRPASVAARHWRTWQGAFLILPTLIVIGYMATRFAYPDWMIARRGFTGWERLLIEAQLLWVYLQKALFGITSVLGVYQTPPGIGRSLHDPVALLAAVSWLGLAAVAVIRRRRWPLFGLAILWYLTGHVIESTVLPLELYFEHRNYLPVIGPIYALVVMMITGHDRLWKIAGFVIPLYVIVSAYFLYSFASLSGDPSTASRYWAIKYPDSVRAVTTMASYQLAEEGPISALSTIDRFVIEQPQHGYLRIQELNLRCMYLPLENHDLVLTELSKELPGVVFTFTAGRMLSQLLDTVAKVNCEGVDLDTVAELAQFLRQNPAYLMEPGYNHFHHKLMASIARQQGDLGATIDNLEKAISYQRSSELNMMMVTTLGGAGDFKRAREFIDTALKQQPLNPFRAIAWRDELEKLRDYIDELERYSQSKE